MSAGPQRSVETVAESSSRTNPFATRYVRPGTLSFEFPAGVDAASLVVHLAERGWMAEVVGPHGTGKSTLLATLAPTLVAAGRTPYAVTLHDGERRLPAAFRRTLALAASDTTAVVVVDGFEQLGRWSAWSLRRKCRRRGWGLLVTAHGATGLPRLLTTSCDPALAQRLAAKLQSVADQPPTIAPGEVAAVFAAQGANMRETLFALYDLVEARRRAAAR